LSHKSLTKLDRTSRWRQTSSYRWRKLIFLPLSQEILKFSQDEEERTAHNYFPLSLVC
jgi:hypothetical protein